VVTAKKQEKMLLTVYNFNKVSVEKSSEHLRTNTILFKYNCQFFFLIVRNIYRKQIKKDELKKTKATCKAKKNKTKNLSFVG
jgi:hypothetical protein